MGTVSTFGTFTMARLGIYASQQAINVTGNNIANINTDGYTRQSVDQTSLHYGSADRYVSKFDARIGGGSLVQGVDQTRDKYLDIRYRDEQASVGAMEVMYDGLDQLSSVLDEVGSGEDGEGILEARFNEMVEMIERYTTEGAGKADFDTLFRETASSLVNQFNHYADRLKTVEDNEIQMFNDDLDDINSILYSIRDLDAEIRKSQMFGGDALEQQDRRNLLIDKLSKHIHIDVTYDSEQLGENVYVPKLKITTSDLPQRTLVDGIYATQLSVRQVEVKDADGNPVLDENGDPVMQDSPNYDLNIGELLDAHDRPLVKETEEVLDTPLNPTTVRRDEDGNEMIPATLFANNEVYPKTGENGETYSYALRKAMDEDGNVILDENGNETYETDEEGNMIAYRTVTDADGNTSVDEDWTASVTPLQMSDAMLEDERFYTDEGLGTTAFDRDNVYEYTYELQKDEDGNPLRNEDGTYTVIRTQIFRGEARLSDTELDGGLQARRELLTEEGEFAGADDLDGDENASVKRGVPYYRKALDVLANTFARVMNECNMLGDTSLYVMGGDGLPEIADDGSYQTRSTANAGKGGGVLFSNNGMGNDPSGITAANISISQAWSHADVRVLSSQTLNAPSMANDNLRHILSQITSVEHNFYPTIDGDPDSLGASEPETAFFTGSFQKMFTNNMAGTLAIDTRETRSMLDNYTVMSDELYVSRDAVMGVDLNDEAMDMMRFQKSFSAACRLMTTFDTMLDKLINGTAV